MKQWLEENIKVLKFLYEKGRKFSNSDLSFYLKKEANRKLTQSEQKEK